MRSGSTDGILPVKLIPHEIGSPLNLIMFIPRAPENKPIGGSNVINGRDPELPEENVQIPGARRPVIRVINSNDTPSAAMRVEERRDLPEDVFLKGADICRQREPAVAAVAGELHVHNEACGQVNGPPDQRENVRRRIVVNGQGPCERAQFQNPVRRTSACERRIAERPDVNPSAVKERLVCK